MEVRRHRHQHVAQVKSLFGRQAPARAEQLGCQLVDDFTAGLHVGPAGPFHGDAQFGRRVTGFSQLSPGSGAKRSSSIACSFLSRVVRAAIDRAWYEALRQTPRQSTSAAVLPKLHKKKEKQIGV